MHITTNSVRERDRFQLWNEYVCDTIFSYEIKLNEPDRPFFGSIVSNDIGDFKIIRAQSVSQKLARTPNLISKTSEETIGICYLTEGQGIVSQDNREAILKPGFWTLCDSTRPFSWTLTTPHHSLLALSFPKSKISNLVNTESMTASAYQCTSGLGKIIFGFIFSILKELEKEEIRSEIRLKPIIIDLLVAFFDEHFHYLKKSSRINAPESVKLIEIKNFIKDNLRDPDLCVEMISNEFQMSTRYCHTLFQTDEKSICQYVRELRLLKCKQSLEDPILSNRSITDIAFSWGFNNASHFSKLFKKHFGISPKELRAQTLYAGHS